MDIADKNIKKLNKLLALMDEDTLTKEEFIKSFEKVIDFVKQIENKHSKVMDSIQKTCEMFIEKMQTTHSTDVKEMRAMLDKRIDSMREVCDNKISEMDKKMKETKDGKDADEEAIVSKVLSQIQLPEQKDIILDSPEEIRNKLELLQGDERLEKTAIKGLEDEIKKLRQEIAGVSRGGSRGMRKVPVVKSYNLSSQVNGTLKAFVLPNDTVKVLGVWGTQFPVTFNENVDWTFAGKTLTLTDQVGAPQTGQTLFCLIETLFY